MKCEFYDKCDWFNEKSIICLNEDNVLKYCCSKYHYNKLIIQKDEV